MAIHQKPYNDYLPHDSSQNPFLRLNEMHVFVSMCFEILFWELNHLHVFCIFSDPDSLGIMEMYTAQAHPQIKWIGSGCKVAKDACDPPNILSNR